MPRSLHVIRSLNVCELVQVVNFVASKTGLAVILIVLTVPLHQVPAKIRLRQVVARKARSQFAIVFQSFFLLNETSNALDMQLSTQL